MSTSLVQYPHRIHRRFFPRRPWSMNGRRGLLLAVLILFLLKIAPAVAAAPAVTVEVSAGAWDRVATPVHLPLPEPLASVEQFRLTRADNQQDIPAQRIPGDPPNLAWLLREPLPAGQQRRYQLAAAANASQLPQGAARCTDDGRHLWLQLGDRKVLRYNHAVQEPPEGLDPCYRRSGYIHPVYTPSGKETTGDFAPDHAHQHGVFLAWVNTTFRDRKVDFWNQKAGLGSVEHVEIQRCVSGPVFAEFTVGLRHTALNTPAAPETVLEETWKVRAWNVPRLHLFDLTSVQRCVSDQPLAVNEYHYGGMAIRGNGQWLDTESVPQINRLLQSGAGRDELAAIPVKRDYLTSEGKSWFDGNGTRARWVEMFGSIDGQPAGVAICGHPDNFRAPQPVRLHPQKPYFCFAPMILGEFQLAPGTPFTSRYRYCVHDGPVSAKRNERIWRDFASPPAARIVE